MIYSCHGYFDLLAENWLSKLFGKVQNQIVVVAAAGIRLTNDILVPDTASIRKIASFDVQALCASISAVKSYSQINRVGLFSS